MALHYDLTIDQGGTLRRSFQWVDQNSEGVNITACHLRARIFREGTPNAELVLTDETGELIITDPLEGEFDLLVQDETTDALLWPKGSWRLDVLHPDGSVTPLREGAVTVRSRRGDTNGNGADETVILMTVGIQGPPGPPSTDASLITEGTLPAAVMPALTGDVSTAVGTVATVIGAGKVGFPKLNPAAWSDDTTLGGDSSTQLPTQHAVKTYVDNFATGLQWKPAVACASNGPLTLSGEQLIDGVATNRSRVLVKNQIANAKENGIYISGPGAWLRAADANSGAELISATVFVSGGIVNGDTQWTCTNDAIVIDNTAIAFAQVSGAGTYTAGAGLALNGNSFSIAAGGVTAAMLAPMTSAQLAGLMSDETGSGALVFATSPSLVTPNLGAATAAALTVTTGPILAPDGTAAAPSHSFTNETGMGMTRTTLNILGFYVNGVRQFDIRANGQILVPVDTAALTFGSSGLTRFSYKAPQHFRFGLSADAPAPAAYTLSVESVSAGTADTAGANWTMQGSRGTGTGAGGSIIFQVAPPGTTGSAQNALVNALTIAGDKTATFSGNILNAIDGTNSIGSPTSNRFLINAFGIAVATGAVPVTAEIRVQSGNGMLRLASTGLWVGVNQNFSWSSGDPSAVAPDLILARGGPANLRHGAADAATPVAQTLSVQNVLAGTSNTAGADWTFQGSRGTGTGAGGSIIFQVAPAGTTGTAQNALTPALTINGAGSLITLATPAISSFINLQVRDRLYSFSDGVGIGFSCPTDIATPGNVRIGSAGNLTFMATASPGGTQDIYVSRVAAGVLQIGTAGGNALGSLKLANIIAEATNGTKIGTVTSEKLGFWGAAPVVQQVLPTGAAKTVDNVISFLQTIGLCKQA